jgi:small acid-soluble spore protein H (minor)
VISLNKKRIKEIIESPGIIEVTYKNDSVWLESLSTDKDGKIKVKDLNSNKHLFVNIDDLKE